MMVGQEAKCSKLEPDEPSAKRQKTEGLGLMMMKKQGMMIFNLSNCSSIIFQVGNRAKVWV